MVGLCGDVRREMRYRDAEETRLVTGRGGERKL